MAQPLAPSDQGLLQLEMLSPHQEAMLEACQAGRLAELQKLFDKHDVKRGEDPVRHFNATQDGAPETAKLFDAAISYGQRSVVRYMHSIYPKFDFYHTTIVSAFFERPDLEIFKLIYSYSPRVIHFEFDDHTTSLLGKACEGGPDNAPFIDFLLDHEATAAGYMDHFGEALTPAIQHDQPIAIIKKMIPKTQYLSFPIHPAVKQKRADALELLLDEEQIRSHNPSEFSSARSLLSDAQATQDKQVIAVVERYIYNEERQVTKSTTRQGKSSNTKPEERRRWWQFRTQGEAKHEADVEDSASSATQTGAPEWWVAAVEDWK